MKNNRFRIFVINPGSTSTKLALFENNIKILETSVTHDAEVLNSFAMPNDQLGYRMEVIKDFVEKNDIDNFERELVRICETQPFEAGACRERARAFEKVERFTEYVKFYETIITQ